MVLNDPESQLLLACVRRTIDPSTAGEIRSIVESGLDWTRVAQAALHHRVVALVYRGICEGCPDAVPAELLEALRVLCEDSTERAGVLSEELCAIVADCARRSVTVIPFKGPALAQQAFGHIGLRATGDLDLIIRESDVAVVSEILEARGYARDDVQEPPLPDHLEKAYQRYERQIVFVRRQDGVVVEPQWSITTHMLAFAIDYDALRARAQNLDFQGRQVPNFAPEDTLLLLCIHGIKHYWNELRWIADIAALIEAIPDLDLEVALRRAEDQGCLRVLLLGLALARALIGTNLPDAVQQRLDADRVCQGLVEETAATLFSEGYEPPDPLKMTSYRMRMRERLCDRWLSVWRTVVTPRVPHFRIVRLPPALQFLYYPIKLIHDYLLLPAWLAMKSTR